MKFLSSNFATIVERLYQMVVPKLALEMMLNCLLPDKDGKVCFPDRPGLVISPNLNAVATYLVDIEIQVGGQRLYQTPIL